MLQVRIGKRFAAGPEAAAFSLAIEFEATAGVTVLFGPSGSGKTLTLDAIAGFVRPEEGRILLDGDLLFDGATGVHLSPRVRRCGYVFPNYALFPHMTLRRNLEFAAARRPRLERHRRVSEMLDRFHLGEVAGRRPHEVSLGQKQRCAIARALIAAPKVLLLDEPARGLEAPLRAEFHSLLRQVREEFRTPVLLATHDIAACFELGEDMLVLREGRVVQSGPPREVADAPANVSVARLLGIYNLLPVEIRALDPAKKSSRVRYGGVEIAGPYFPGHFIGDRVQLCVRPEQLRALPRDGRPGPNQAPARLLRAVEKPSSVRLEFEDGLAVEAPREEYERHRHAREWVVEFPAGALRAL